MCSCIDLGDQRNTIENPKRKNHEGLILSESRRRRSVQHVLCLSFLGLDQCSDSTSRFDLFAPCRLLPREASLTVKPLSHHFLIARHPFSPWVHQKQAARPVRLPLPLASPAHQTAQFCSWLGPMENGIRNTEPQFIIKSK